MDSASLGSPAGPWTEPPTGGLQALFSPRSVAVIGASREPSSIGFAILHNLLTHQFNGAVYPVNPKAGVIHSVKAYRSIADVPDPVDLAVIVVPRDTVEPVVDDCLACDVKGLVVISAGFGETGAEGRAIEDRLRSKLRQAGVRMIGPNCMGVINADPEISLNATFAPTAAERGSIGFVSQSGALGVAILNAAAELGIGFTQFASMGNKTDVSANDLLEYWENDEETRVICMYLESFGNPRRFAEIAKRVSRQKPILIVKSGRTEAGARAASSHTGAIAGTDVTVSAFLRQCGVLRANTIEELFDTARALDSCPLPSGGRVAIVTNAGGPGIMATDACVNLGLEIAELGPATETALAEFLPAAASLENPVDMIAAADVPEYERAIATVVADPGVDSVLAIHVTPLLTNPIEILDAISRGADGVQSSTKKPVLSVVMAKEEFYAEVRERPDLPPVYRFPESAVRALAQLTRYAAWRDRPDEEAPGFEVDDQRVVGILTQATGRPGESSPLASKAAFEVLESYGIPVAPYAVARTAAALEESARTIGFPVVLKAEVPGLVHKSDVGAVRVGIQNVEELAVAVDEMVTQLAEHRLEAESFLLQRMVDGGHEVIFGISTDDRFGPLLMFGLGGRYVEVFRDVCFGVPPISRSEAREMVRGIRGFPLLAGTRGDRSVDLDLLEEILLRLSQLVRRHPSIRELDINPLLASDRRGGSLAVDVRMRVVAP